MFPNGFKELETAMARSAENIREFFSLPGGILGNDTPSGEALREANMRYIQASRDYAERLSEGLTLAVRDYASISGLDPAGLEVEVVFQSPTEYLDLTTAPRKRQMQLGLLEPGFAHGLEHPLELALRRTPMSRFCCQTR
ncbi:MAG: hypothetical protein C4327_08435 [Meiothermus sp.]